MTLWLGRTWQSWILVAILDLLVTSIVGWNHPAWWYVIIGAAVAILTPSKYTFRKRV